MNVYEYQITKSEDPALNGRVLAFATSNEEAEDQLRSSTFNGARFLEWSLVKIQKLAAAS